MQFPKVVLENDPGSASNSKLHHQGDVRIEHFKNVRLRMQKWGNSAAAIRPAALAAFVLPKRGDGTLGFEYRCGLARTGAGNDIHQNGAYLQSLPVIGTQSQPQIVAIRAIGISKGVHNMAGLGTAHSYPARVLQSQPAREWVEGRIGVRQLPWMSAISHPRLP